ncbi:hypothetical protein ES708_01725 [subsurface metagenome]
MAKRQVTKTKKNSDGDILALCNPSELWSPRSKNDAINDIESKNHYYYVKISGSKEVIVRVIDDIQKGKYLRTDWDDTSRNNLRDLPDC